MGWKASIASASNMCHVFLYMINNIPVHTHPFFRIKMWNLLSILTIPIDEKQKIISSTPFSMSIPDIVGFRIFIVNRCQNPSKKEAVFLNYTTPLNVMISHSAI